MNALRQLWTASGSRERRVVVALVAALGLVASVWFIHFAQHARARLGPVVMQLRVEAARLDADAREVAQLRALPATPQPQTHLRQQLLAQVDGAGLGHALASIEMADTNRARLVFTAVPFDAWQVLLKTTQAQRIRLDTVRLEAQATPGLVSVTATFVRPVQ